MVKCSFCFIEFKTHPWKLKKNKYFFCQIKHYFLYRKKYPYKFPKPPVNYGKDNFRWNNHITFDKYGYRMIFLPNYPKSNSKGFCPEHRYIVEQHIGRMLHRSELIHHINHDRLDNRIENLMIVSRKEHIKIHPPRK